AYALERQLFDKGATVVLLDGSTTCSGLSRELDYSPADRAENLRRVAHVSRILNDQGIMVICSYISPDEAIRQQVKDIIGAQRFKLIYMDATLEFCQNNKPELYEKSKKSEIHNLPGMDERFDVPSNADLVLKPENAAKNIAQLLDFLDNEGIFPLKA
ncbi:MAG: adenylyl-sulfate kinase, partial [Bacteroidales bacterium]|nr:adenylyl-sulfate kinase [Bacteroidales bacterium]